MDLATGIALASLVLSLAVLYIQHRAGGRAHFTVDWESASSLLLINHGPGAAKNLRAAVGGKVSSEPLEVPYVGAFQTLRFSAYRHFHGVAGPITLSYRDNHVKPQKRELHLPDPPGRPHMPKPPKAGELEKVVRAVALDEASKWVDRQAADAARRARR